MYDSLEIEGYHNLGMLSDSERAQLLKENKKREMFFSAINEIDEMGVEEEVSVPKVKSVKEWEDLLFFGVSNCCSAEVKDGVCTDCKEPCEEVESEEWKQ